MKFLVLAINDLLKLAKLQMLEYENFNVWQGLALL
jgi:hypothetical protein